MRLKIVQPEMAGWSAQVWIDGELTGDVQSMDLHLDCEHVSTATITRIITELEYEGCAAPDLDGSALERAKENLADLQIIGEDAYVLDGSHVDDLTTLLRYGYRLDVTNLYIRVVKDASCSVCGLAAHSAEWKHDAADAPA